jgi:hypothetical protein
MPESPQTDYHGHDVARERTQTSTCRRLESNSVWRSRSRRRRRPAGRLALQYAAIHRGGNFASDGRRPPGCAKAAGHASTRWYASIDLLLPHSAAGSCLPLQQPELESPSHRDSSISCSTHRLRYVCWRHDAGQLRHGSHHHSKGES